MSSQPHGDNDPLAYGDDYNHPRGSNQGSGEGERGFVGDTFRILKSKYDQRQSSSTQNYGYTSSGSGQQATYGQSETYTGYPAVGQSAYQGGPPTQAPQKRPDLGTQIFSGLQNTIQSIGTDVAGLLGTQYNPPQQGQQAAGNPTMNSAAQYQGGSKNRFDSFVSEKNGNDVKWYVDGCGYFWAVSQALEGAKHSIWILDWWLSPELYLRRPPAKNEEWRLDRVLQRAAQRGVKINIIVYKEVTQALSKAIFPSLNPYLHSLLPNSTDKLTSLLVKMGLEATSISLQQAERQYPLIEPPLALSSAHTKHALESLSPNIGVFRHPDHLPDAQTAQSSILSSFQGLKLDAASASKLGADALKGIYGFNDDLILFWAHHEKLCLIDGRIAFMGGLDMCFGRWDTNQHFIADAHPSNLTEIAIPGQDYNNARVMDFSDVEHPFQNKLDRTKSSRMGWSDISVSLQGTCVSDLRHHFIDRWNFIYDEKYNVRKDVRYSRLTDGHTHSIFHPTPSIVAPLTQQQGGNYPPPPGSQPYTTPAWQSTSRPHTPNTLTTQVGETGQPVSYSPGYGPSAQTGIGQTFPPPPPGPPPQSYSPQPQQGAYGTNFQPQLQPPLPPPHPAQPQYGVYEGTTSSQPIQSQPPLPHSQQYPSHENTPAASLPSSHSLQTQQYGTHFPAPSTSPSYVPFDGSAAELPASQPGPQAYQYQPYQPPSQGLQDRDINQFGQLQDDRRGFDGDQGYRGERGSGEERGMRGKMDYYKTRGKGLGQDLASVGTMVAGGLENKAQRSIGKILGATDQYGRPLSQPNAVMSCQILRSAAKWSNGTPTEQSIQNAYIDVIQKSQHFVYIENQFFITATGDKQRPVKNLIGKALVERIVRAAQNREKYMVIVLIPAVPAFAGDLREDSSLGTRAIMEYQYNSINRGGNSIMELIAKANINPMDYIRFYNLRNYDRINAGSTMSRVEQQSGVSYEDARKQHDDMVGAGYGTQGEQTGVHPGQQGSQYQQYQTAAQANAKPGSGRWDTVSECYMLGGEDIRNVPWDGTPEAEFDAFVSEELYVHSKCLIADDRIVICGSANLNDRSQVGYHDSEIAILINDPTPVQSTMAGQPWTASRFASSLRRQLFRKHLGLLRPQDMERPDANFAPVGVPNMYDWGSPEDNIVSDPLSDAFLSLWNTRARTNTEVYRKAFRAVPDDLVTTWAEYKEFYEYYFHTAQPAGKDGTKNPSRVEYGHVVREDFPGGVQELKELLSRVKGTLVEMPLCFLQNEDIAKEGLTLNAWTDVLYT